jgi:hypothetical protein
MSCLLYVNEEEAANKINIDDLYEKKHQRDLKTLSTFNKILGRVHKRIQFTGRNKRNAKNIWFTVPEYIFGEPNYDNGECVAYLVTKLEDNGFFIRYIHPNTLYISWENWIPTYARNEFKKRTGIVVDERGNVLGEEEEDKHATEDANSNTKHISSQQNKKQFTPIDQYKPTGNLVYKPEMFEKIEKKVHFNIDDVPNR